MSFGAIPTKRRQFCSTDFGLDRDTNQNNNLPSWKQDFHKRILQRSHENHVNLMSRLKQNRENKHISPNSKLKQANDTIDNFKKSIIANELSFQNNNNNNNNNNNDIDNNNDNNINNCDYIDYEDLMLFLEDNYFKEIRDDENAKIQEYELALLNKEDEIMEDYNEYCSSNPILDTLCPICNQANVEIECVSDHDDNNNQATMIQIYSCSRCNNQWQPFNSLLRQRIKINENNYNNNNNDNDNYHCHLEDDKEHAIRMLQTLKNNLSLIYNNHFNEIQCKEHLTFFVENKHHCLQVSCKHCNKINELVV